MIAFHDPPRSLRPTGRQHHRTRLRYLVLPKAISVPLKFQREGIKYDDLSEDEKDRWDATEWGEDGEAPDQVESEAVNRWLFNTDTVDKVLAHLMTHGVKVADGDRLAKTIIFAKSQQHAQFIEDRFNHHFPHHAGQFARTITFKTEYAQSLIDAFSHPDKPPHIAVSADMLDTGIDVPEIGNLVLFKLVRSKTKFWQMLGRGTRLRPDLFAPGRDKTCFYLFDYCQNLEYFSQNPNAEEGALGRSLGQPLFTTRLDLIGVIDEGKHVNDGGIGSVSALRDALANHLQEQVAGMRLDNFLVRPHRRLVERYREPTAWQLLSASQAEALGEHLAGLPSAADAADTDQSAKHFDLLMFNLMLAVLRQPHGVQVLPVVWSLPEGQRQAELEALKLWPWFRGFMRLRDKVVRAAAALSSLSNVPMVAAQLKLIDDIQSDHWWFGVTAPLLDEVRRKLRALMDLIEKETQAVVFTDFEDEIGVGTEIALPGFTDSVNYERFRAKALAFLKAHEDHLTIRRLRRNEPLTPMDLAELERILVEAGVGSPADLEAAKAESEGLGLFVRSLVGMERDAAKRAFDGFIGGRLLGANQIQFIDLIVDHLTEHGAMAPSALYESPYTDKHPSGVGGLFSTEDAKRIAAILADIRQRATMPDSRSAHLPMTG